MSKYVIVNYILSTKGTRKRMRKLKPIQNKQSLRKYTNALLDKNQTSLINAGVFYPSNDYKKKNEEVALSVIRFAIEEFLGWTPEEAVQRLNSKIITEMKLDEAINKLNLPEGSIVDNDYSYVIAQIYPWVKVNLSDLTIKYYKHVLDDTNNKSFVRRFFAGADGRKRSVICLHYLLGRVSTFFSSIEDMYDFFSGVGGDRFLSKNKLKLAKQLYTSDVEYLHKSLSKEQRDDFLFHYYQSAGLFWGTKRKLARITRATDKVARTMEENEDDEV